MTQITREEAVINMKQMIVNLEASIADMERALSVSVMDDQPYVLVLDAQGSVSALKRLGANSWNMSAQGTDAATFSLTTATKLSEQHGYKVMPKRHFWANRIESAKATIEWALEIIGEKAAA